MKNLRDYEKWIDDIRDQLYREMQELGKEEFNKRREIRVREVLAKHGLKTVPSQSVRLQY